MKLIARIDVSKRLTGKIYHDKENDEYIVGLYVNKILDDVSTYFTDDRLDAIRTLYAMLALGKQLPYEG